MDVAVSCTTPCVPESGGGPQESVLLPTIVVIDIHFVPFLSYLASALFPVFSGIAFQIRAVYYQAVSQAVLGSLTLKACLGGQ